MKRGVHGLTGQARRCCFVALAAAVLAACATFQTGPFLKEQITGDTWRACLAREYQAQARARVRADRDWRDATRWAAKGRAALAGEDVALSPDAPPALAKHTCACATAQARFDAASKAFDEALAACETSAP